MPQGQNEHEVVEQIVSRLDGMRFKHKKWTIGLPEVRETLQDCLNDADMALGRSHDTSQAATQSAARRSLDNCQHTEQAPYDQARSEALQARNEGALPTDDLSGLKVHQLKERLRKRKLPVSGNKAELCRRLFEAMAAADDNTRPNASASERPAFASIDSFPAELQDQLKEISTKADRCGPQTGIFTDGACSGNPGPGGWGFVYVKDGHVQYAAYGSERQSTTNNRMEFMAIISALQYASPDEPMQLYSDSQYCVKTLNEWAENWLKTGKKDVKNFDLVQAAFALRKQRPNVQIEWVRGHAGTTFNEYADCLATWSLR
eukprot:6179307-Pleurochrysis_carterae.AAC.3